MHSSTARRKEVGVSDPMKWDWADAIAGALVGLVGGIVSLFSWFYGRVLSVETKLHARVDALALQVNEHESNIAVLEAQHVAKMERLEKIDGSIGEVHRRLDRQMEVLLDLRGRTHHHEEDRYG